MKNIWLIVLMVFLLLGCGVEEPPITESIISDQLNIYLVNSTSDQLVEVAVEVDTSSLETQVAEIIEKLTFGDAEEGLLPTIPESTMIEAIDLSGARVVIHVTEDFLAMHEVDLLICRSSLIKSLTAIEGVDAIEFYSDGLPLKDEKGKVYGAFYQEDVVTYSNTANSMSKEYPVTLYYPDERGDYLVKTTTTMILAASESIEASLIETLMTVPPISDVVSPIPEGTVLKNIKVIDGICYVDFNENFRSNHYGGSTGERMTVYSIVNTLTELPNVSRVQFLIEGEKTSFYKGHLDFSQLFEYNIELIGK